MSIFVGIHEDITQSQEQQDHDAKVYMCRLRPQNSRQGSFLSMSQIECIKTFGTYRVRESGVGDFLIPFGNVHVPIDARIAQPCLCRWASTLGFVYHLYHSPKDVSLLSSPWPSFILLKPSGSRRTAKSTLSFPPGRCLPSPSSEGVHIHGGREVFF
jgi:hypothetical protein